METLPKSVILFGFNLSASVYIGIGAFGSLVGITPRLAPFLSVWSSLLFGAGALLCTRGIYYFGSLWDRMLAREAEVANTPPAKLRAPERSATEPGFS